MNAILTNAFKRIIEKEQLIDTGALLSSVVIDMEISPLFINIYLNCEDYVKYHIEERNLLDQFFDDSDVSNEIYRLLDPVITNAVTNSFLNVGQINIPEDIIFYLNGEIILRG